MEHAETQALIERDKIQVIKAEKQAIEKRSKNKPNYKSLTAEIEKLIAELDAIRGN